MSAFVFCCGVSFLILDWVVLQFDLPWRVYWHQAFWVQVSCKRFDLHKIKACTLKRYCKITPNLKKLYWLPAHMKLKHSFFPQVHKWCRVIILLDSYRGLSPLQGLVWGLPRSLDTLRHKLRKPPVLKRCGGQRLPGNGSKIMQYSPSVFGKGKTQSAFKPVRKKHFFKKECYHPILYAQLAFIGFLNSPTPSPFLAYNLPLLSYISDLAAFWRRVQYTWVPASECLARMSQRCLSTGIGVQTSPPTSFLIPTAFFSTVRSLQDAWSNHFR